jgi:hypothetical protein
VRAAAWAVGFGMAQDYRTFRGPGIALTYGVATSRTRRLAMRSACLGLAMLVMLTPGLDGARRQTRSESPANGAISGIVVDGGTGAPLEGVIVTIAGAPLRPGYQSRQATDARGRFAFVNLADAESYQLTAARFGYLDGGLGRDSGPTDPLRAVAVRNGGWVANLKLPIWRPGAISGTVRDEAGEPVIGVIVRAIARVRFAGREELASGPLTLTDDHGMYRLAGLVPARYVIQVPSVQMSAPAGTRIAAPSGNAAEGALDVDDQRLVIGRFPLPPPRAGGRTMTYGITYHPNGSSLAQATTIDLKFGETQQNVDLTLAPVPAVRVSGTVEGPAAALANRTARLLPAGLENLGLGGEIATALVASDGAFTFLNVPAGAYTLEVPATFNELSMRAGPSSTGGSVGFGGNAGFPTPPPAGGLSRSSGGLDTIPGVSFGTAQVQPASDVTHVGRMSLTVGDAPITGVIVRLSPMGTLKGRLVLEPDPSKPAPATPSYLFITLDPASGQVSLGMPRTQVPGGGSLEFEVPGVQPGEYWIRARNDTWLAKSIVWHGREYIDRPIDTAGVDDLSGLVITMTTARPELTGTVRMSDGSEPAAGLVIAFPADPAQRINTGFAPTRLQSAPLQNNGVFRFTSLPAGSYLVAAIDRPHIATWRDPAFLSEIERQARRVTLTWGQTTSQDLTMAVSR